MDNIIYTGQKTAEEVKSELNKLLNEFLRELHSKESEDVA